MVFTLNLASQGVQRAELISLSPVTKLYLSNRWAIKVKLAPKCNQGFICECIWVKPLCKCIITTKEALQIYHSFISDKLIFDGVQGHSYANIKFAIFKTLKRLDTTWIFACSITRVSTHEHEHWEQCLCTQSLLKREYLDNSRGTSWQTKSVDQRVQQEWE